MRTPKGTLVPCFSCRLMSIELPNQGDVDTAYGDTLRELMRPKDANGAIEVVRNYNTMIFYTIGDTTTPGGVSGIGLRK